MGHEYRWEMTCEADSQSFAILDPDGDEIATVSTQVEAEALISHLNR